jgi:hypothetical protein
VLTDTTGNVEIDVPRDRAATFEPQIVKKRQRRLSGVDEVVLSLYAKGLTTGEISAHFAEIYGASVSKETISPISDKVIEEMNDWAVRPLDETRILVVDATRRLVERIAARGRRRLAARWAHGATSQAAMLSTSRTSPWATMKGSVGPQPHGHELDLGVVVTRQFGKAAVVEVAAAELLATSEGQKGDEHAGPPRRPDSLRPRRTVRWR